MTNINVFISVTWVGLFCKTYRRIDRKNNTKPNQWCRCKRHCSHPKNKTDAMRNYVNRIVLNCKTVIARGLISCSLQQCYVDAVHCLRHTLDATFRKFDLLPSSPTSNIMKQYYSVCSRGKD
jgi:hypothetical protein